MTNRKHRVKIGDIMSSWVYINGGVPQGTKLATLLFLVMVNNFQTNHRMIKYINDASVTEEGNTPNQILMDLFPPQKLHFKMMLIIVINGQPKTDGPQLQENVCATDAYYLLTESTHIASNCHQR